MHKLLPSNSFQDARGKIEDLVIERVDAITRITFEIGAVRGNHFHKETTQWTFVLKGTIQVSTIADGVILSETFTEGDLFVSLPNEPHAMQAVTKSEILVFTSGPRSGDSYAIDTYRIDIV